MLYVIVCKNQIKGKKKINSQAVCDAIVIVSSCLGNFLPGLEQKQPIYGGK